MAKNKQKLKHKNLTESSNLLGDDKTELYLEDLEILEKAQKVKTKKQNRIELEKLKKSLELK